jgi:hypothetical protein
MAKAWVKFPHPDKSFVYTAATLKKVLGPFASRRC